jgi:hypothetical protein
MIHIDPVGTVARLLADLIKHTGAPSAIGEIAAGELAEYLNCSVDIVEEVLASDFFREYIQSSQPES